MKQEKYEMKEYAKRSTETLLQSRDSEEKEGRVPEQERKRRVRSMEG